MSRCSFSQSIIQSEEGIVDATKELIQIMGESQQDLKKLA
tara:strand:- start:65 stop:184 length:120 start_codon:yes stop_codon:yes gene_type:complete